MNINNIVWNILAVQIMLHNLTGHFASYTAIAGVAVLFMTAIVGMSGGGGALTVNMTVFTPTAAAILFAFGAVGIAIARVKRASNIRVIGMRILGERLLEGLARMSEE